MFTNGRVDFDYYITINRKQFKIIIYKSTTGRQNCTRSKSKRLNENIPFHFTFSSSIKNKRKKIKLECPHVKLISDTI